MEQLMRAHDLAIAALLGDTIYNFGELVREVSAEFSLEYTHFMKKLQHPILDSLNGTEHEWIKNLLFIFNEGNIGGFESLAPLFGREVSVLDSFTKVLTRILHSNFPFSLAYPTIFVWFPQTKDLPHGSYRKRVQAKCYRAWKHDIRNDRAGDKITH